MNTAVPTWLVYSAPIVSLVIGYLLTSFNDSRKDSRQLRRENNSRAEQRALAKADSREEFELSGLRNAYDALGEMILAVDTREVAVAKAVTDKQIPIEEAAKVEGMIAGDPIVVAAVKLSTMVDLILDDDIRAAADAATKRLGTLFQGIDASNFESRMTEANELCAVASDKMAARIRSIYNSPVPSITAVSGGKK